MPFGLCNSPATFQRLIETVLTGLIPQSCMGYIDDPKHLANLRAVFERLRAANLRLKPVKCHFGMVKVDYLGYVVSREG